MNGNICKRVRTHGKDELGVNRLLSTVYIEVCLGDPAIANDRVVNSLKSKLWEDRLISPGPLEISEELRHAGVTDVKVEGIKQPVRYVLADLYFFPYKLCRNNAIPEYASGNDEGESIPLYFCWEMPHVEFHGLWDSLLFDNNIKEELIGYATAAVTFGLAEVSSSLICWNRLLLLYGPPGTGKTSLGRAVAQKVSIRFSERYSKTIFIELNSQSLLSKWFSESGKQITAMFEKIRNKLSKTNTLVCLLIDEVETLVGSRKHAAAGGEPSDSVRVVNVMLTQLDTLKRHSNLLIVATSNVIEMIDPAFLDRVDFKHYVPIPAKQCRYSILVSCLKEMQKRKLLEDVVIPELLEKTANVELQNKLFDKGRNENLDAAGPVLGRGASDEHKSISRSNPESHSKRIHRPRR